MPKYKLSDMEKFTSTAYDVIQKTTMKRYGNLHERVLEAVREEAAKLFTYILKDRGAINSTMSPFRAFGGTFWQALSKPYIKRKGHSRYWYYTGRLGSWLGKTDPLTVFGLPTMKATKFNPKARGYQKMTLQIDPFPMTNNVTVPEDINNRLFAKRIIYGKYQSNDDLRPLIEPAIKALVQYRIRRKVSKVMKEALQNDK